MADNDGAKRKNTKFGREDLARKIVMFSMFGLVGFAIIVIVATAWVDRENLADSTTKIFNALLPLFGTWVGTVLAYYFSKQNFESANRSVQDIVKLGLMERLRKVMVKDAMLPLPQMRVVKLAANQTEKDIKLKEGLLDLLKPPVTRIPVLNHDGSARYVIHQSMLFKFVCDRAVGVAGGQVDVSALTLEDFCKHGDMRKVIELCAFVGRDQTLAEAKLAMERLGAACQDVFVTEKGKENEPVEGWITNVEIGKHAQA